jgi:hypothetical protein
MSTPQVPDPKNLAAVQSICDLNSPFDVSAENDARFVDAMREITRWHAKGSTFYAKVLQERGFDPASIRSLEDLKRIPFIPAGFFKTHEVLSVPRQKIAMHFTSSGTSGQKSQMFFDQWSLSSGQRMVDFMFGSFGWINPSTPHNYLLYTYETEPDSTLGTAYTDNYLCKFAPMKSGFFGIRRTGTGGHDFDVFGCIERLRAYESEGLPVRILGFPSFLYFTLERMKSLRIPNLKLSRDSLAILGGGWKGHADKAISKKELYARVEEQLGIPESRVRDSFGAVEHGIPYTECAHHQFHVPVWSRVIIRDLRTLEPKGFGEPGFLQFLTPFVTSVPAHSLMMGDLATLHPASECGCGIQSPYFVVHGRAGTSKNRSCAVAASELLERAR